MPRNEGGDFAAVADALYAVPASTFVAERNARAKAARADGDRDLAARVTALPKPSASASLVNRLVRDGGAGLDRLLDLGAALRVAQVQGDGGRLRALGTQRRELLGELTRSAAERAERADKRPSASVLEELEQTLLAALLDDGAAAAVRTGRLVHALSADGLDPADLTDAVGGPAATAPRPRTAREDPPDEAAEDRRRADAESRAADAADRAATARQQADEAAQLSRASGEAAAQQEEIVQDLRRRLDEAQEALDRAEQTADEAHAAETNADRAATAAEQEAADLRDALER